MSFPLPLPNTTLVWAPPGAPPLSRERAIPMDQAILPWGDPYDRSVITTRQPVMEYGLVPATADEIRELDLWRVARESPLMPFPDASAAMSLETDEVDNTAAWVIGGGVLLVLGAAVLGTLAITGGALWWLKKRGDAAEDTIGEAF